MLWRFEKITVFYCSYLMVVMTTASLILMLLTVLFVADFCLSVPVVEIVSLLVWRKE